MCSGLAIILTGKGYKEHHWLVVPPSTTLVISHSHHYFRTMPSSSCTISGTVNHLSIGHAAVCVCGQTGTHTNQGQAITPFMFNEEEYRVSVWSSLLHVVAHRASICVRICDPTTQLRSQVEPDVSVHCPPVCLPLFLTGFRPTSGLITSSPLSLLSPPFTLYLVTLHSFP